MENTQLGRSLNQRCLRLQDRRKRLIEIGRYLLEIPAVFALRLQAQGDTDLIHIRQCLDDARLGNR